jgi:hypothetical protein
VEQLVRLAFSMLFVGAIVVSFSSFFYSREIMELLYPMKNLKEIVFEYFKQAQLHHPIKNLREIAFEYYKHTQLPLSHIGYTKQLTEVLTPLKNYVNLQYYDYHQRMKETSLVFGFLMGCFVPISTTYVFGTLLTANGNLKQLNIMAASGMALNIILNVFLIPRFYATGSSLASFTTQFATSLIQVIIAQRIFKFKVNVRFLISLLIFVIGMIIIGYFSRQFGNQWTVNLIIMISLSGALAIALRIINFRDMFKIIKNG